MSTSGAKGDGVDIGEVQIQDVNDDRSARRPTNVNAAAKTLLHLAESCLPKNSSGTSDEADLKRASAQLEELLCGAVNRLAEPLTDPTAQVHPSCTANNLDSHFEAMNVKAPSDARKVGVMSASASTELGTISQDAGTEALIALQSSMASSPAQTSVQCPFENEEVDWLSATQSFFSSQVRTQTLDEDLSWKTLGAGFQHEGVHDAVQATSLYGLPSNLDPNLDADIQHKYCFAEDEEVLKRSSGNNMDSVKHDVLCMLSVIQSSVGKTCETPADAQMSVAELQSSADIQAVAQGVVSKLHESVADASSHQTVLRRRQLAEAASWHILNLTWSLLPQLEALSLQRWQDATAGTLAASAHLCLTALAESVFAMLGEDPRCTCSVLQSVLAELVPELDHRVGMTSAAESFPALSAKKLPSPSSKPWAGAAHSAELQPTPRLEEHANQDPLLTPGSLARRMKGILRERTAAPYLADEEVQAVAARIVAAASSHQAESWVSDPEISEMRAVTEYMIALTRKLLPTTEALGTDESGRYLQVLRQSLESLTDVAFAHLAKRRGQLNCPELAAERCRTHSILEDQLLEWRWGASVRSVLGGAYELQGVEANTAEEAKVAEEAAAADEGKAAEEGKAAYDAEAAEEEKVVEGRAAEEGKVAEERKTSEKGRVVEEDKGVTPHAPALESDLERMAGLVVDLLTRPSPSMREVCHSVEVLSAEITARALAAASVHGSSSGASATGHCPGVDQGVLAAATSTYMSSLTDEVVKRLAVREAIASECAWQDGREEGCASRLAQVTRRGLQALLNAVCASLEEAAGSLVGGDAAGVRNLQKWSCLDLYAAKACRDCLNVFECDSKDRGFEAQHMVNRDAPTTNLLSWQFRPTVAQQMPVRSAAMSHTAGPARSKLPAQGVVAWPVAGQKVASCQPSKVAVLRSQSQQPAVLRQPRSGEVTTPLRCRPMSGMTTASPPFKRVPSRMASGSMLRPRSVSPLLAAPAPGGHSMVPMPRRVPLSSSFREATPVPLNRRGASVATVVVAASPTIYGCASSHHRRAASCSRAATLTSSGMVGISQPTRPGLALSSGSSGICRQGGSLSTASLPMSGRMPVGVGEVIQHDGGSSSLSKSAHDPPLSARCRPPPLPTSTLQEQPASTGRPLPGLPAHERCRATVARPRSAGPTSSERACERQGM